MNEQNNNQNPNNKVNNQTVNNVNSINNGTNNVVNNQVVNTTAPQTPQPIQPNLNPIQPQVSQPVVNNVKSVKRNNNANPTGQVQSHKIKTEVLEAPKEQAVEQTSSDVTDNIIKAKEALKTKKETTENKTEITPEKTPFKKKVQYFFLTVFLILVAVFIYFLPEVTEYIEDKIKKNDEVTTGVLECRLEKTSNGINTKLKTEFAFSEKKLKKFKQTKEISARTSQNSALKNADEECNKLLEERKSVSSGFDVTCSYKGRFQKQVQTIDYQRINIKKVTAAFEEAGGTYPNYKLDQNIDEIESDMQTSGYRCTRENKG